MAQNWPNGLDRRHVQLGGYLEFLAPSDIRMEAEPFLSVTDYLGASAKA